MLFRRMRRWPSLGVVGLLLCGLVASGWASTFGFENVAQRARELSQSPYRPPPKAAQLEAIDYDAYRDIRFKPTLAHWRRDGLPFELMFLHSGRYFTQPIQVHEVDGGVVKPIAVGRDTFDFGRNVALAPGPADLAGFRVHFPLNGPEYKDEVIVFHGASYFRAVGAGQLYGLSARGLAVDTAAAAGREEFPHFESFWVERPARDARELVIHALLNGPRVTGAYRFVVKPGEQTVVDVTARLFLRAPVATLGIAPLTSMFLAGENQPQVGDFRPEVHDSDGLSVHAASGEWIWRPLTNPSQPFTTSFASNGVRGFGLMQRDRAFASYEDTEARYERRPNLWITPKGDWGPGRVELMQFHVANEFTDNVVAYWVPHALPPIGQPIDIAYEMRWQGDRWTHPPGGWTLQSRRGRGAPLASERLDELQYHIDFVGPALEKLPADANVQAVASSDGNGAITFAHAYRHPVQAGWRATVRIQRRSAARATELRVFLRNDQQVLTETWSYAVPPD